jgi:DNA-binding transcriptional regulator LsrR (DeoR family)
VVDSNRQSGRLDLLADIAEMYFLQGKNQAEIARRIGMTRSNISRMLTEARNSGVIQIHINRPLQENHTLAQQLVERFGLINARVVKVDIPAQLLDKLGQIASKELLAHLKPGWILGTSWGTAIHAAVDQLEVSDPVSDIKVAQMLGALGARIKEYDGHSIVRLLEQKLSAEGIYINAPFLVENKDVAHSLLENKSVHESLNFAKRSDIALLGVGSSELAHCSYYLADYVTRKEIRDIQKTGAIGDVCGRFFNLQGEICAKDFQQRFIGIFAEDLLKIPLRMGIAGGPAKIEPILGALRGKLINILVSDEASVKEVLKRSEQ